MSAAMPVRPKITSRDRSRIGHAVAEFERHKHLFANFAQSLVHTLTGDPSLSELIHFIKWRVKDEASLRHKLTEKTLENKAEPRESRDDPIDKASLFHRVPDLAGVRILHLHTDQMREIHPLVLGIIDEQRYELAGPPIAHCWDVEYENYFKSLGIETVPRDSMYTTVHYDLVANQKRRVGCELQIRSLMDEVWSEVSHRVNYPHESHSESCRDQLKVLARLTTGGTRLVDSIFKAHHAQRDDA